MRHRLRQQESWQHAPVGGLFISMLVRLDSSGCAWETGNSEVIPNWPVNRANHSLTGSGRMLGNVEIEGRTAEFWQRSKNALAQVSARRHA
jgi:hypothetical protein